MHMKTQETISLFWFRRDLRIIDNNGLYEALKSGDTILPIFIFDTDIIEELEPDDARVSFIYKRLTIINNTLSKYSSSVHIEHGKPIDVFEKICKQYRVNSVFTNRDYEPYAIQRDRAVRDFLSKQQIPLYDYKDQVIFEAHEVMKKDGLPYTVFTPYKNRWRSIVQPTDLDPKPSEEFTNYLKHSYAFPSLESLGMKPSEIEVPPFDLSQLNNYETNRNIPSLDATSHLSTHLRFGTVSIRSIFRACIDMESFSNELIWRSFFMQILFHYPTVVHRNFRSKYDHIEWRNISSEFELWKRGETGYPMVDAGMRELNETGYMHNRVRMVVAGFLCKHLLIDWRWGEAYFAEKLLDYELSSNNGNWQWAAGTGCDAAPYFRVFNPSEQIRKFDPEYRYIKKWVPEYNDSNYPAPMVEHKEARERAIRTYKMGISKATE